MFSTHRIIIGTIKKIKDDFAEVSSGETDEHRVIPTSTAPDKHESRLKSGKN